MAYISVEFAVRLHSVDTPLKLFHTRAFYYLDRFAKCLQREHSYRPRSPPSYRSYRKNVTRDFRVRQILQSLFAVTLFHENIKKETLFTGNTAYRAFFSLEPTLSRCYSRRQQPLGNIGGEKRTVLFPSCNLNKRSTNRIIRIQYCIAILLYCNIVSRKKN